MSKTVSMTRDSVAGVLFEAGRYCIIKRTDQPGKSPWQFPGGEGRVEKSLELWLKQSLEKIFLVEIQIKDLLCTYCVVDGDARYKRNVYWVQCDCVEQLRESSQFSLRWVTLEQLLSIPFKVIDQPLVKILEDLSFA